MDTEGSLESLSDSTEDTESDESDDQSNQEKNKIYLYTENALLKLRDQYLRCANMEFPGRVLEIKDILDKYGRKRRYVYEDVNIPTDNPIPMDIKLIVAEVLSERVREWRRKKSKQKNFLKLTLGPKLSSVKNQVDCNRRMAAMVILSDLSPINTERVFKGTNIPVANYNGHIESNKTVKMLHNKLKEEIAKAHNDLDRIIIAVTIQYQYDVIHKTSSAEYVKGILERLRQRFKILDSNKERMFKYHKIRADLISKLIRQPYCNDLRATIYWIDWNECKGSYLNLRRLQSDYAYFLNLIASIIINNSSELDY